MAEETQEGQKTVVSFVVGLLIGGLLVWAFSGPAASEAPTEVIDETEESTEEMSGEATVPADQTAAETKTTAPTPTLSVGEGKIEVSDQPASAAITLASATYPISEGWVGVRDYTDGQLGAILGVVRFSESQGLVPSSIVLQRSTTPGREYAVVVFEENGDRQFNLANDAQIDSIYATFTAR